PTAAERKYPCVWPTQSGPPWCGHRFNNAKYSPPTLNTPTLRPATSTIFRAPGGISSTVPTTQRVTKASDTTCARFRPSTWRESQPAMKHAAAPGPAHRSPNVGNLSRTSNDLAAMVSAAEAPQRTPGVLAPPLAAWSARSATRSRRTGHAEDGAPPHE